MRFLPTKIVKIYYSSIICVWIELDLGQIIAGAADIQKISLLQDGCQLFLPTPPKLADWVQTLGLPHDEETTPVRMHAAATGRDSLRPRPHYSRTLDRPECQEKVRIKKKFGSLQNIAAEPAGIKDVRLSVMLAIH